MCAQPISNHGIPNSACHSYLAVVIKSWFHWQVMQYTKREFGSGNETSSKCHETSLVATELGPVRLPHKGKYCLPMNSKARQEILHIPHREGKGGYPPPLADLTSPLPHSEQKLLLHPFLREKSGSLQPCIHLELAED